MNRTLMELGNSLPFARRKYELLPYDTVTENGRTLYRIRALRDFGHVRKGDLGGYVESERNLSHKGECWILGNAKVVDGAHVYGNAIVGGNAEIRKEAEIKDVAFVHGNATVCDKASVADSALVAGEAKIGGSARIGGRAKVSGRARVGGESEVRNPVNGDAMIGADQGLCNSES